ncbi:hypothetical protein HHX47_DHR7000632 [Lentinula edodes]|nr:hypothetical protein HHX47_DHR7000632 [Lentinula edodes]
MTDSESEVTSHLLDDFENASDQFLESDSAPVASGSHHVPNTTSNNRTGKNQHRESGKEFIEDTMREEDSEGFQLRDPTSEKIPRTILVCIGPHQEWSGDGHDKLAAIGFPIWGVRDIWSGKWLGLWVVPNNRLKDTIGYLYLKLVHEYGVLSIRNPSEHLQAPRARGHNNKSGEWSTRNYGLWNTFIHFMWAAA